MLSKLSVILFCVAAFLPNSTFARDTREVKKAVQSNYGQVGKWTDGFFTAATVHLHVLPNGKVLSFPQFPASQPPCPNCPNPPIQTYLRLWDPVTNTLDTLLYYYADLFCSGHSLMADGRLLITGGTAFQGPPNAGISDTTIFDSTNNSITNMSMNPMNTPRWYPTNLALGNGETLVISGSYLDANGALQFNNLPQVWQTTGGWRDIPGAATPSHLWLYPWMHLAADGRAYNSGPTQSTYFITTTGSGSWSQGKTSLYGLRDEGSSVMYDTNKILIVGGGNQSDGPGLPVQPTNTAETINLSDTVQTQTCPSPPCWNWAASMIYRRRHMNATILPNGKVLVTGGTSGGGFNNTCTQNMVKAGEIWDPATNTWSLMSEETYPRLYHSAAVLLQDGRVLVGGTTPSGSENGCRGIKDQIQQTEIFWPPYLFDSNGNEVARPFISSAPTEVTYGQNFTVEKSGFASNNISKVTLVKLSSTTHSFNENQRFNNLTFNTFLGGLNVTMPTNPNACPKGHYMLFIINNSGVPSVAKIVKVV